MKAREESPGNKTTMREAISRRTFIQLSAGLLGAAAISGPELLMAQQDRKLSIATGGTGGVYYVLGGAMANMLTKNIPNTKFTSEATAASVENAQLIVTRNADIALMLGFEAQDAYLGRDKFKIKVPLRTLLVVYSNLCQFVAREGINTVHDLKGKRVSLGAPGSGSEVMAVRILQAAGLDPEKDIKRDRLSHTEAVGAMKDRKIDAFNSFGALPYPALVDLTTTPGIKVNILDLGGILPKLQERFGPVYFKGLIPKGTYRGIDVDVNTAATGAICVCHEAMDEGMVYQITKLIIEKKSELAMAHKAANDISLQSAVVGSPLPYHPGAIRYYKEKGIAIKQ